MAILPGGINQSNCLFERSRERITRRRETRIPREFHVGRERETKRRTNMMQNDCAIVYRARRKSGSYFLSKAVQCAIGGITRALLCDIETGVDPNFACVYIYIYIYLYTDTRKCVLTYTYTSHNVFGCSLPLGRRFRVFFL